jgi:DNA-binding response OmpR family regulator
LSTPDNRVLLVDDERDITLVTKKGLVMHDFQVTTYNDPAKALEDFKPNQYDLHVFDIRMPGMSGFDLARKIWQVNPKAHVCFLSAFEIFQDEANKVFKDLNTKCFIKKPITASSLADHLKTHMAERRSQD